MYSKQVIVEWGKFMWWFPIIWLPFHYDGRLCSDVVWIPSNLTVLCNLVLVVWVQVLCIVIFYSCMSQYNCFGYSEQCHNITASVIQNNVWKWIFVSAAHCNENEENTANVLLMSTMVIIFLHLVCDHKRLCFVVTSGDIPVLASKLLNGYL